MPKAAKSCQNPDTLNPLVPRASKPAWRPQDEMCNMYMMTYSELPVFMTCGNGNAWYQLDGPGGIPPASRLAPEDSAAWQPPPPLGAPGAQEPTMGQISGELQDIEA